MARQGQDGSYALARTFYRAAQETAHDLLAASPQYLARPQEVEAFVRLVRGWASMESALR